MGTTLSQMVFAVLADRAGHGYAFVFIASAALITNLLLITPVPETARLQAVPSHAAATS